MSSAASGLLRALIVRSGMQRNRILLTLVQSTDWQSLTFVGERHEFELRITGPNAAPATAVLCNGIEDAEFTIPGQIVADIAVVGTPETFQDGSIGLRIEALTVSE